MTTESEILIVARERARDAASAAASLRADLVALTHEAKPARAVIRLRDDAVAHLAELREQDAQRGADALARSQKASKPDSAIVIAETVLASAERDAAAGEILLTRLRSQADAIGSRLAAAEAEQGDAAGALVVEEHGDALAAWDRAAEALGSVMVRLDAIHAAARRLRVALRGGTDAPALRAALRRDGLVLSGWGSGGRDRPSWLHAPDAAAVAEGAAALLAQAGLPADHFVRPEHTPIVSSSPIRPASVTVTPRAMQPEVVKPAHPPRRVDFGPSQPTGPVRIDRDDIR